MKISVCDRVAYTTKKRVSLVSSASRWLKTDLWVQDMRLRDRLLKETDLTLEKAVSRASDTSKFQLKELEGGTCIVEGLVPDKRHIYAAKVSSHRSKKTTNNRDSQRRAKVHIRL